jgi:hypothetical protein
MNAVLVLDGRETGAQSLSAFKKHNPEMVKILRILDVDWPVATVVYRRLCAYVSNKLIVDGEPLVFRCLKNALEAYERALGKPDDQRFVAFLNAMITPAAGVLRAVQVIAIPTLTWRAEDGVPLAGWLRDLEVASPAIELKAQPREPQGDEEQISSTLTNYVMELNHG